MGVAVDGEGRAELVEGAGGRTGGVGRADRAGGAGCCSRRRALRGRAGAGGPPVWSGSECGAGGQRGGSQATATAISAEVPMGRFVSRIHSTAGAPGGG